MILFIISVSQYLTEIESSSWVLSVHQAFCGWQSQSPPSSAWNYTRQHFQYLLQEEILFRAGLIVKGLGLQPYLLIA